MTILENENKKNKQLNDPLFFTEEEKRFIEMSFRIVRGEAKNPSVRDVFKKEDISIDNEDHVRKVIKLYHDYFRMPAGRPHRLKEAIFRKLGYYQDGKTTLEAHRKKILDEKLANEKKLAEITLKRKQTLSEEIKVIKKELKEIEENPIVYKYDLTKEYEKIEKELKENLAEKEQEQSARLQELLQKQREEFEKYAQAAFDKASNDKKIIEEETKKQAILKSQQKLTEAMERIEQSTPEPTLIEDVLVKRNEEIEVELHDFEGMTVKELRDFANSKDINWTYNHRKADLIELIKSELGD